jgi:hypothetical protein
MRVTRLHQFLIPSTETPTRRQVQFWLSLSLSFAVVYLFLGLQQAFSGEYVVQDDARQHVFWMRRFLDPALFPNDLIADYFQSTAPVGYAALYRLGAIVGIDPLLFNKLLPIALALVSTLYCFGVCLQLLPVPFAGFVAALLLNQNLWLHDDLVSGIARAFVFPIFLAFLYYLLRRALLPCLVTIALQGWFYPQLVFIMSGVLVLRLLRWNGGLRLVGDRQDYWLSGMGLAVAFAVMLPYAIETSPYAPVVTVAEAKTMAEFQEHGRTRLFVNSFWEFWFTEERTGAFLWVMPLCFLSIGLLPIVLRWRNAPADAKQLLQWEHRNPLPLAQKVRQVALLWQIATVSLAMFLAAHALLFTFYLPSRYTRYTFQMVTALTGAIVIAIVIDGILRWAQSGKSVQSGQPWLGRPAAGILAAAGLAIGLLLSPYLWEEFPMESYVVGDSPELYAFFAAQPQDSLIASLAREADNLPTFAQRSILTSREYSVPYHLGYYQQIYQRTDDLIRAQYSADLAEVQSFIQKYGVDFWLIDRRYLQRPDPNSAGETRITRWLQQFQPTTTEVTANLDRGATPVVRRLLNRCSAPGLGYRDQKHVVLSAACILQAKQRSA